MCLLFLEYPLKSLSPDWLGTQPVFPGCYGDPVISSDDTEVYIYTHRQVLRHTLPLIYSAILHDECVFALRASCEGY